jgi:1-phosphofructokinase/tagatose 6-phosphate kinase
MRGAARPDVVTPNLAEAEGLLHGRADEAVEAAPDARPRALAAAAMRERAGHWVFVMKQQVGHHIRARSPEPPFVTGP